MIELTTSLLMLASVFSPAGQSTGQTGNATSSDVQAPPAVNQPLQNNHPLSYTSTEAYVRAYFKDIPLLAEISRCESTFRQFDRDGNVIRGKVNSDDIGIMQINKYYHEEDSVKLGFDIYTIDGNLGYARWLYNKYGDKPWVSSSPCWGSYREIARK